MCRRNLSIKRRVHNTVHLKCQTCGGDVVLWQREPGMGTEVIHDAFCPKPMVIMTVHNPRKLGVITNITDPDEV